MTPETSSLIAPCGSYCGYCPFYRAMTDETLRLKIAQRRGMPVNEVPVCAGCRKMSGNIKFAGGNPVCELYTCAIDNKGIEFCYQCREFPCPKLQPCADRAHDIPLNMKVYNLLRLQEEGVDAWVEKYPERMRRYFQGKKTRPGSTAQP